VAAAVGMELVATAQVVQAAAARVEMTMESMPHLQQQIQAAAAVVTGSPTLQTTGAAAL